MPRLGKLLVSEGDFLRSLGWMAQVALTQKSEQADGSVASKRACTEAQLGDPGGSHPSQAGHQPCTSFYPPCRVQDPACPGGEEAAGSVLRRGGPAPSMPHSQPPSKGVCAASRGIHYSLLTICSAPARKGKEENARAGPVGKQTRRSGAGDGTEGPRPHGASRPCWWQWELSTGSVAARCPPGALTVAVPVPCEPPARCHVALEPRWRCRRRCCSLRDAHLKFQLAGWARAGGDAEAARKQK